MDNQKNGSIDVNELLKKAASGELSQNPDRREIDNFIDNNLSSSQASAIKDILGDEEKTKAILNSDAAKVLFKKFFGGQSNGGF